MRSLPALRLCAVRLWALSLLLPLTASAQSLLVDDFSTDQALTFAIGAGSTASSAGSTAGADILGGERDMQVGVVAGAVSSGEVTGGAWNFSVAAATSGEGYLVYDGPDGLPDVADLDATGLGGVDLTVASSQDALLVRVVSSDQPGTLIVTVYTDAANFSTFTQAIPVTAVSTDFVLPFSSFSAASGTGADFTNVGAVSVFATGFEIDLRIDRIATTGLLTADMTDALLVDTDSDGQVGPGDTVRYTTIVNNPDDASDVSATGVLFDLASADPNTSLVVGSVTTSQGTVTTGNTAGDTTVAVDVGTVADAGSVTITYDVVLDSPLSGTVSQLSEQGRVTSDSSTILTDDPDNPAGTSDPTITPVVQPDLEGSLDDALLIDVGGDGMVSPGDTVRYTASVSNSGSPASGVQYDGPAVANASLVAGSVTTTQGTVTAGNTAGATTVAVDIGTIGSLGSITITYDVVVDDPLAAAVSQLTTQGTVSASNSASVVTADPDNGVAIVPTVTPVVAAPDLSLSKTDGGANVLPGGDVSYTLTVTNVGDQDAAAVELTETVPANTIFSAAASSAGWACVPSAAAGSTCTLTVGALGGGGASTTRTFAVTVDDPVPAGVTTVSNSASVSDPADTNAANDSATDTTPILVSPDVSLTKTDGGATATPGSTIVYTLNVSNVGTGAASAVVLTETVPANTSFAAGSSSAGWACAPSGAAGGTCTLSVGSLASSASTSRTFAVTVASPLPAGVSSIVNTASVSDPDDGNAANDTASDTTPVAGAPAVSATKSAAVVVDADADGRADPGDTVEYTVVVTSTGTQDAVGLSFNDMLDVNTSLVVGSVTTTQGTVVVGNSAGDTSVAVDVGTLGGLGGAATLVFRATLADPFPSGVLSITNQGSVVGTNVSVVLTDDPATTPGPDPTVLAVDPVVAAPAPIPTLDTMALLLFALMIGGYAVRRL